MPISSIVFADSFEIKITSDFNEMNIDKYYEMYENVKGRSLELNTFSLPKSLFENIANSEQWEVIELYLKSDNKIIKNQELVGMVFCHKGENEYAALIAGIDYKYSREYNTYRQMIAQIVERACVLRFKSVGLGFTSTIEKKHFGANVYETCAYLQIKDNYNMEALGNLATNKNQEYGVNKRRVLCV